MFLSLPPDIFRPAAGMHMLRLQGTKYAVHEQNYFMKNLLSLALLALAMQHASAQDRIERPKLVVGIVVDQMRYDYLYRFYDKFGKDGFRKLMSEGFLCRNTRYNYVPTYTGPGHAAIYTGTTPSVNGIIANDWYDRSKNDTVYCVRDSKSESVGAQGDAGRMSPRNLLSTTITDELKLATNSRSKVIGVSLKDRGAILPAGHMADAAYWFDSKSGNWISSSYYIKELPGWASSFNDQKQADQLLSQPWNTVNPPESYTASTADSVPFEAGIFGSRPVFPYNLPKLKGNSYEIIRYTPFGNTITRKFAEEAVKGEQLGKGEETDFLAVSFSSTDYIGHAFGPNSVEIEDTYIRLDRELAEFISFLENHAGKSNVLVFLTSDHGVAHVPEFLSQRRIPSGVIETRALVDSLNRYLNGIFGPGVVSCYINRQIYLNYPLMDQKRISAKEVQERIAAFLLRFRGISGTITSLTLRSSEFSKGNYSLINNGFNLRRSGDIIVSFEPGWFEGKKKGSTHGEPYTYDIHVPLLWYGWGIRKGSTVEPVSITDIAPTLAEMLHIEAPNGCTGQPIPALFR
jgi:predicted AlkP superfamily pyrophosphatase or phosphodiesterase